MGYKEIALLSSTKRGCYEVCCDEVRRVEVRRATTTTKMATSTAMALFMMKDGEVFTPQAALLLGRQSV